MICFFFESGDVFFEPVSLDFLEGLAGSLGDELPHDQDVGHAAYGEQQEGAFEGEGFEQVGEDLRYNPVGDP